MRMSLKIICRAHISSSPQKFSQERMILSDSTLKARHQTFGLLEFLFTLFLQGRHLIMMQKMFASSLSLFMEERSTLIRLRILMQEKFSKRCWRRIPWKEQLLKIWLNWNGQERKKMRNWKLIISKKMK
jgi:hypothetical protein